MFNFPYTDMFFADATKQLQKIMQRKAVLHRQTCLSCNKTLVNVYWTENGYRCRKCKEAEQALKDMRKE